MEDRLLAIELKVLSLEDTVAQLNEQMYAQQRQLDELRALCRLLIQQQEEAAGGASRLPVDERPPHY